MLLHGRTVPGVLSLNFKGLKCLPEKQPFVCFPKMSPWIFSPACHPELCPSVCTDKSACPSFDCKPLGCLLISSDSRSPFYSLFAVLKQDADITAADKVLSSRHYQQLKSVHTVIYCPINHMKNDFLIALMFQSVKSEQRCK